MATLENLGLFRADCELLGDLLGDRVARNGNGACEETVAVEKQQIGTAPADIEDHDAFVIADMVGTGHVIERRRSEIHQIRLEPDIVYGFDDAFDDIILDDNEHHLELVVLAADELVVPDHLVHRERHVLPCLVFNDLADSRLLLGHRRQLHETHEGGLAAYADESAGGRETTLFQRRTQRCGDDQTAILLRQLLGVLHLHVTQKNEAATRGEIEFADAHTSRPNVENQHLIGLCHIPDKPLDLEPFAPSLRLRRTAVCNRSSGCKSYS